MKKKVATAAIAAMTMTFLAGCSSRGTYAKYLTLGEYKGLSVTKVKTEVTDDDVEAEIESALDENAEYTDVDLSLIHISVRLPSDVRRILCKALCILTFLQTWNRPRSNVRSL